MQTIPNLQIHCYIVIRILFLLCLIEQQCPCTQGSKHNPNHSHNVVANSHLHIHINFMQETQKTGTPAQHH